MLVLGNGKVITRDPACPLIENGAVAVDGTAICRVGARWRLTGPRSAGSAGRKRSGMHIRMRSISTQKAG